MNRFSNIALPAMVWLTFLVGSLAADPLVYEPGTDPGVGMNLASWWNFGATGPAVWEGAVQDLYDHGFRHVSFVPLRFVDKPTGHLVPEPYAKAPDLAHVAAGVARAKALGMTVTINPFVQPTDWSWRGFMNFSGAKKTNFFSDYQAYLLEVAQVAQDNGAARMTIGSELRALTQDSSHNPQWAQIIDAVDAVFQGQFGYAANWDAYRGGNLTSTIWENPKIDFLGVDAYFPLATNTQADASGAHPDEAFIALLEHKWTTILEDDDGLGGSIGILEFAQARKGGTGMPVVFTEHGLIPFNRTTVQPHSENPGYNEAEDPDEQVNGYDAVLRATDAMGDTLLEIDFWHWGMEGANESFWYTHPEGVDDPWPKFRESLGNQAGQFLTGYVVPEPGSLNVWAVLATLAFLGTWRARRRYSV